MLEKKECENVINVLEEAKQALKSEDILKLKDLSNRTIHSICRIQDPSSITISVIIYSLSKLVERKDSLKIKRWPVFVKKIISIFELAIKSLKENREDLYEEYLTKARTTIESISVNLKPYIKDVLRKSSINKASKVYEHGISMEQTSKLLGITQWELSEYIGQTTMPDVHFNKTLNVKERAKMALQFLT